MSDVAGIIADLVRAGVSPELIGRTAAAFAERAVVRDEQAERRREKDRERKRLRSSAESAEKEVSPTPPSRKTTPQDNSPTGNISKPPKLSARQELETTLDAEHAAAVVEHRRRLNKPLTPYAARLMAKSLAQCPDPNAAAERMIERGWRGIDPAWMRDDRNGPNGHGPPRRETELQTYVREIFERSTDAERPDDEPDYRDITASSVRVS